MTDAARSRPARRPRLPAKAATARNVASLSLLLLDNANTLTRVVRQAAKLLDIRSVSALSDPRKALAAVAADSPPDVALVNWNGPRDDAVRFCRTIRDPDGFRRPFIPLLMLAHSVTREMVLTARDAGVDEFLAVPFSPMMLEERLLAILHNRRGFVHVPSYFGPDRRRGAMADWLGADRRSSPGPLIDPDSGRIHIG